MRTIIEAIRADDGGISPPASLTTEREPDKRIFLKPVLRERELLCPGYEAPNIIIGAPMSCAWLPAQPARRPIAIPCCLLRPISTGWARRQNAPSRANRRRRPLAEAGSRRPAPAAMAPTISI